MDTDTSTATWTGPWVRTRFLFGSSLKSHQFARCVLPSCLFAIIRQRKSKIENFEETIMENKNVDNISDSAVPVDHTEMPVDDTGTPVTPVEMAVGPAPPVVLPVRPSDSSAIRSDYTDQTW